MIKVNKIVSTLVLICFLFNTAISDLAFGLATPSGLSDIVGIQHKDIGRIKLALEQQLVTLDHPGLAVNIGTFKTILKEQSFKEKTIFQPADMQFFFREIKLTNAGLCVMVRLKDRYGLRSYYATFSLQKDENNGFPITVYTEEQYKATGAFTKGAPQIRDKDAKAIARYVQHEKGIDTVIGYAHEQGFAKEPISTRFDYRDFVKRILSENGIKATNPEGLIPVEDRNFFLVKLTKEIQGMISANPAIVVDAEGREHTVLYYAHSSNNAIHVFIKEEAFEALTNPEYVVVEPGRNTTYQSALIEVEVKLSYEMGVPLGFPVTVDNAGNFLNELNRRSIASDNKRREYQVNPLEVAMVNLDTTLVGRDYATAQVNIEHDNPENIKRTVSVLLDKELYGEVTNLVALTYAQAGAVSYTRPLFQDEASYRKVVKKAEAIFDAVCITIKAHKNYKKFVNSGTFQWISSIHAHLAGNYAIAAPGTPEKQLVDFVENSWNMGVSPVFVDGLLPFIMPAMPASRVSVTEMIQQLRTKNIVTRHKSGESLITTLDGQSELDDGAVRAIRMLLKDNDKLKPEETQAQRDKNQLFKQVGYVEPAVVCQQVIDLVTANKNLTRERKYYAVLNILLNYHPALAKRLIEIEDLLKASDQGLIQKAIDALPILSVEKTALWYGVVEMQSRTRPGKSPMDILNLIRKYFKELPDGIISAPAVLKLYQAHYKEMGFEKAAEERNSALKTVERDLFAATNSLEKQGYLTRLPTKGENGEFQFNLTVKEPDYKAIGQTHDWSVRSTAHENWATEEQAVESIVSYLIREGGPKELAIIVEELVGNQDERLEAVFKLLLKHLDDKDVKPNNLQLNKELVASMIEKAGAYSATNLTINDINKKFTRPEFIPSTANLTKIYGEVDNYVVCRYDAGKEGVHYIVIYDKTNGKVPEWFTKERNYPLEYKGWTEVRLYKEQHLIVTYNTERTNWDDNSGLSEHYALCDTKTKNVVIDSGAAYSYLGPKSFMMSAGEEYCVLLERGVNYNTRYVDRKQVGHEARAGFDVYSLVGDRTLHSLSSFGFSRDYLSSLQDIKIVGGHYLLMEYLRTAQGLYSLELYDVRELLKTDTLPKPLFSGFCDNYAYDAETNMLHINARKDYDNEFFGQTIDLSKGATSEKEDATFDTNAVAVIQREIATMIPLASEAGLQIPTHPKERYNLLITSEFFANGEFEKHRAKYGDRFDLDRISGRSPEQFVDNILAKASGKETKTIALVPSDLLAEQLERLTKVGIRFVRVNTTDLLKAKSDKDAGREKFQIDTYAMMLLLRRIDNSMTADSSIYRLLSFYLKSHFALTDKIAIDDYIMALVNNDVARLIKGCLAYRPAQPYEAPNYNNVAASLISA